MRKIPKYRSRACVMCWMFQSFLFKRPINVIKGRGMATTNWITAQAFQDEFPHTFNALQHLVMSMADFANSRGKKTIFGRDKGLAAYKKFEEKFKDTLLAMVLDGLIERNATPTQARTSLIKAIDLFATAFPNWQDAYRFANEFLVDSAEVAEDCIRSAMR